MKKDNYLKNSRVDIARVLLLLMCIVVPHGHRHVAELRVMVTVVLLLLLWRMLMLLLRMLLLLLLLRVLMQQLLLLLWPWRVACAAMVLVVRATRHQGNDGSASGQDGCRGSCIVVVTGSGWCSGGGHMMAAVQVVVVAGATAGMLLQHICIVVCILGVRVRLTTRARLVQVVGCLRQGTVHGGHGLATASNRTVAAATGGLGPPRRMAIAQAAAGMRQRGGHAGASKAALLRALVDPKMHSFYRRIQLQVKKHYLLLKSF